MLATIPSACVTAVAEHCTSAGGNALVKTCQDPTETKLIWNGEHPHADTFGIFWQHVWYGTSNNDILTPD